MALKMNIWPKVAVSLLLLIILLVSSIPEQGLVSGEMDSEDKTSWDYSVNFFAIKFFNLKSFLTKMVDGTLQYVGQCGNGMLDIHENCDDGNLINGDGCSSVCQCDGFAVVVQCPDICGDGIIIVTEECDDGNLIDHDGCSAECLIEELVCGNSIFEPLGSDGIAGTEDDEECDGGPFCNEDCTFIEPTRCFFCGADLTCIPYDVWEGSCPFGMYESLDICRMECGDKTPPEKSPVPPDERDITMCAEPNPLDLPEGTRFRDVEDGTRHISVCEELPSEDCLVGECSRHIICRPDGGITVNIIPCPKGPCVDGACLGDPTWHPACLDSDRGVNPRTPGGVWESGFGGEIRWEPDECSTVTSVYEQFCIDGMTRSQSGFDCVDFGGYCDGGACVPGEVTCSETDEDATGNGNNPFVPGVTTITSPTGSTGYGDTCSFDQADFVEQFCSGSSARSEGYDCNTDPEMCDAEECRCEHTIEGARCVPGELPIMTCHDDDLGEEDIFTASRAWLERSSDGATISMTDRCLSPTVVEEAVCAGDGYDRRSSPCPEGYLCFRGACVEGRACSRTEATDTTAGYVTDIAGLITPDICIDATHLEIYECGIESESTGLAVRRETIDCSATGEVCRDGLCV